jgi:hypothetical protein
MSLLYRDPAGKPVVQEAYCPHLGPDLSVGEVVEGQIRRRLRHSRQGWLQGEYRPGAGDIVQKRCGGDQSASSLCKMDHAFLRLTVMAAP